MASNRTPSPVAEMTDLQLLTYLLNLAGAPEDAARVSAHALLDSYDRLSTVLTLPRSTLVGDPRLDEGTGAFLALVGAMSSRYANRFHRSNLVVMDQETVSLLLAPHLQGHDIERVCMICVDQDFHLLGSGAVVTRGEANSVTLSLHRLLNLALASDAYGIILAHNHPDGAAQFSQTDLMTTDVLRGKLSVLGISLLDHYIWMPNGATLSLYEQLHSGALPPPLAHWDTDKMPLLSRLDPQFSPACKGGKRKRRKANTPFFIEDLERWIPSET